MTTTTDLLRRYASGLLKFPADTRDMLLAECAGFLNTLADQMERAEPVGWLESPYKTFARNHAYKMTAPQARAWRVPLYTHPAPEVTRDLRAPEKDVADNADRCCTTRYDHPATFILGWRAAEAYHSAMQEPKP